MENLINDLNTSINSKNDQDMIDNLKLVIKNAENIKVKESNPFEKLLNHESQNVLTVTCETIAELCKNSENRKIFTNEIIVKKLVLFLESESSELVFNTIRALGNICYENKEGSNLVDKVGITGLLTVLRGDLKTDNSNLTEKAAGLLVNLLNTHDLLPKTALKEGVLPLVENLIRKYKDSIEDHEELVGFLLSIINILSDYLDGKEYVFNESLGKMIAELFKKCESPLIRVRCLEVFHSMADREEVKCLLSREGICDLLFELTGKYREKVIDEDCKWILKMACDLMVLILTGDEVDDLYGSGNGKTYLNLLTWLDSEDLDLLTTGILAVGNFARSDEYCLQMVRSGVAKKLLTILAKYNESTALEVSKVLHGILSTFKNLVIPKENKEQVLKDNIIEILYPMLKQERPMVVFKLLGTFRLIVDGQPGAALYLLSRKDFIERLVFWCYNCDHVGVRGEVPRIFSWLITNCQSSHPFSTFISVKDSVKCLVDLIASNHGIMHNEAFLALDILAISLSDRDKYSLNEFEAFNQAICDAKIGKNLNFVMNKYGDKWEKHVIENCLTMLRNMSKCDKVLAEFKSSEVPQSLEKLRKNAESQKCLEALENTLSIFNIT